MLRAWSRIAATLTLLALCTGADCQAESTGQPCATDRDCEDGSYCNGSEICLGGSCVRLPAPDRNDGVDRTTDVCDEELRTCLNEPPDADSDGVADSTCRDAAGFPLGSDCDDLDPSRYPGAVEVCDLGNVDEACDPTPFGRLDADGDGYPSAGCCNSSPTGLGVCVP